MINSSLSGYNQETKDQLAELGDELKNDELREFLAELGTVRSKGSIFWGAAGTGKSRGAEKFAELIGWKSQVVNVKDLLDSFIHGTAKKVGDELAKVRIEAEKAGLKTLVILDEADALISKLPTGDHVSRLADAREVRAVLLTELQVDTRWVYYIFTTNFNPTDSSVMDAAITRSGRMGKHVHFELPNTKACREIITDILKHQSLDASQVDVHIVTGKIVGRSHAQISELLGDVAKRKFVKKGQKVEITTDDILLAIGEKLG